MAASACGSQGLIFNTNVKSRGTSLEELLGTGLLVISGSVWPSGEVGTSICGLKRLVWSNAGVWHLRAVGADQLL